MRLPAILLLLSGCELGFVSIPSHEGLGREAPPETTPLDPSNDTASAYLISEEDQQQGTPFRETIYPKYDDDYYRIPITGAHQLVKIRLEYTKSASAIQLAIDWIGPRDLCVPEAPTACEDSNSCRVGDDSFCDIPRGGCRDAFALPCISDASCAAAQGCTRGFEDSMATVIEAGGSVQHLVLTTLPAFVEGDYYLRVYDRASQEADADTEYELIVQTVADQDVNEPNDARNLASPLANDLDVNGFFSYHNDVDWYRIDPRSDASVSTPAVVSVELRWSATALDAPTWTMLQGSRETVSSRLPLVEGSERVHAATYVMDSADPIYVRIDNPERTVDGEVGYSLRVDIIEDADEANARNDLPTQATVLDASDFETVHSAAHTLIAENDLDWYRIDRDGVSDNSLLYIEATATTSDFMLQVLVYEQVSGSCDPSTQFTCTSGALCVCPFSGSCGVGQGACIQPWVQRPVPNDPDGDPQQGGRTPNQIRTQLPIYDTGPGAYFVQVGHLTQVHPPRQGFSHSDSYNLVIEHKQEPESWDRGADKDEFFPLPFGVSEGSFVNHRRAMFVGGVGSSVTGYISHDGDQDWYRFDASGIGVGQARLVVSQGGTPLDLRFQVRRGGSRVGDGDRRDDAWNSAVTDRVVLNPTSECTHMRSGDDTIYVWVNDVDFNDFDEQTPYTLTLEMVEGCGVPPCALCRCQPEAEECQI